MHASTRGTLGVTGVLASVSPPWALVWSALSDRVGMVMTPITANRAAVRDAATILRFERRVLTMRLANSITRDNASGH